MLKYSFNCNYLWNKYTHRGLHRKALSEIEGLGLEKSESWKSLAEDSSMVLKDKEDGWKACHALL